MTIEQMHAAAACDTAADTISRFLMLAEQRASGADVVQRQTVTAIQQLVLSLVACAGHAPGEWNNEAQVVLWRADRLAHHLDKRGAAIADGREVLAMIRALATAARRETTFELLEAGE